jgi:predicted DNA-binding transcriptional regulator YafY
VEKGLFTIADITSLLVGLGSIPLTGEDVLATIAKIKGLAPKEQMRDIEARAGKVIVDHTPWSGQPPRRLLLESIKAALDANRLLAFHYYDASGRESTRTVEPYHLLLKEANWYLLAWCLTRQDSRMFRLSRMSELRVLEESFAPRAFEPIPPDGPPPRRLTLTLRVDDSLRGWLTDICGKENLEPCGDGKFLAHYPFIESDYGYGMLLCFGEKCECLEPEPVRREIKRRAEGLFQLYQ